MDKYVLLDFDGVVTSKSYSWQCYMDHCRENIFGMDWFDPACIDALRRIVNETGAKIVVSSSWRDLRMEHMGVYPHAGGNWPGLPPSGYLLRKGPLNIG